MTSDLNKWHLKPQNPIINKDPIEESSQHFGVLSLVFDNKRDQEDKVIHSMAGRKSVGRIFIFLKSR